MMRPRLEAVREVLAPHGAVFVSIDDNEAAHLRLLMDEVFGEANFLAQVVVNLNPKGRQLGRGFATSHEYVLAYARDLPSVRRGREQSTEAVDESDFPLATPDGRRFRYLPLRNTNKKFNPVSTPTLHFPLYGDPVTGRVAVSAFDGSRQLTPVFGDGRPAVWRWSRPRVDERPDDLECRVIQGTQRRARRRLPARLAAPRRRAPQEAAHHLAGRGDRLDRHRGRRAQGAGRPRLRVAQADRAGPPDPVHACPADVVVLDPFAGSGTTGHAVALANAADGGTRRCISINSAEPTRAGSNAAARRARRRSPTSPGPGCAAVADQVGGGLEVVR